MITPKWKLWRLWITAIRICIRSLRETAIPAREDEENSLGAYGFGKQEFDGEELIDIEEEPNDGDEEFLERSRRELRRR